MMFMAKTCNVAENKTIVNYSVYKSIEASPIIKYEEMA